MNIGAFWVKTTIKTIAKGDKNEKDSQLCFKANGVAHYLGAHRFFGGIFRIREGRRSAIPSRIAG